MGALNFILEVIFVPIVVFCIIGWVVFKRKRKLNRRKQLGSQEDIFAKPWDPATAIVELQSPQPVYGGYQQRPIDFPPQYQRNGQPVLHDTQAQHMEPWTQTVIAGGPTVHGYQ